MNIIRILQLGYDEYYDLDEFQKAQIVIRMNKREENFIVLKHRYSPNILENKFHVSQLYDICFNYEEFNKNFEKLDD